MHDVQSPFNAQRRKCTWDLLTGSRERESCGSTHAKSWYLEHLGKGERPRPATTRHLHLKTSATLLLSRGRLLASGAITGLTPCHVSAGRRMPAASDRNGRHSSFVEYSQTSLSGGPRNPDDWKPGRPYLTAIEYTQTITPTITRNSAVHRPGKST